MGEKSKVKNEMPDLDVLISEYSDKEVISILKKRKYYQSEAVEFALKEAIKRKLIYSEQDLFSSEYNNNNFQKESLFPTIDSQQNRNKIRKSIARALLLTGIMPTVWGIVNVNKGNFIEGGLIAFGGLIWIYFSAMVICQYDNRFINSLFVLLGLSFFYLIKIYLNIKSLIIMDIFITAFLYCIILYGLFFLRRLKP